MADQSSQAPPSSQASQPLEDLLARLERERQEADRLYNDALTALDHALHVPAPLPAIPSPADTTHLARLDSASDITVRRDSSLKGRLRSLIWRAIGPPLDTQKQFNAAVVDHARQRIAAEQDARQTLAELVDAVRSELNALARFEALLVQYLQTITLYVDTRDRSIGGRELRDRLAFAEQRLMALKREMEARPAGSAAAAPAAPVVTSREVFASNVDSSTYVGFEDRFRGTQHDIRGRVEDYVPLLAGASDVVDVGCGRGELLDLLQARGIRARGVDANHAMVELCRARGLDVERDDALTYLQRQPDAEAGGIGGLVAIQVVEHFEPAYLARFLETAYHKMRPGAPLILETLNPACWMAFFECYIRDLTHQRPLHPDTLRYLVEATGFTSVDVQFRQPVTDRDRLDRVALPSPATDAGVENPRIAHLAGVLNAHADKLNARLFSSMDYVVIAKKPTGAARTMF